MRSRNRSIESSLKNMKQSKTRDALGANSQFCAQAPPSNCSVAVKVKIPETCKRVCRDKKDANARCQCFEVEDFRGGEESYTVADQKTPLCQKELAILVSCVEVERQKSKNA